MIDPLRLHRLAHRLHRWRIPRVPGLIARLNYLFTGCDIAPAAKIGRRVVFKHFGSGVVLHHRCEIGDDTIIMPQVVVGQLVRGVEPVPLQRLAIGRGVLLGAGAKIIAHGDFTIGDGASIGANAVVLAPVPAGATAVGVPARIRPPRPAESP
jgi:serine O-acetyltransferase